MSLREKLSTAICALPDVSQRKSRFSDNPAFYIGRREIAHFHDGNVIDIRLTRKVIRDLEGSGEADSRLGIRAASDWAEFTFANEADLVRALDLVEEALSKYR